MKVSIKELRKKFNIQYVEFWDLENNKNRVIFEKFAIMRNGIENYQVDNWKIINDEITLSVGIPTKDFKALFGENFVGLGYVKW